LEAPGALGWAAVRLAAAALAVAGEPRAPSGEPESATRHIRRGVGRVPAASRQGRRSAAAAARYSSPTPTRLSPGKFPILESILRFCPI